MLVPQGEPDAVVAGVMVLHTVRGVMEHVGEADGIARCIVICEARADAPEEAVGTSVGGMGVIVEEQRAGAVDAAREFPAERALPAQLDSRADADGLGVAVDAILRRAADGALDGQPVVGLDVMHRAVLPKDMEVVGRCCVP